MGKVHLIKESKRNNILNQCGVWVFNWEVERYETSDYKMVTCDNCKRSDRYKLIKTMDKTMSEIKTEAIEEFDSMDGLHHHDFNDIKQNMKGEPLNSHYNQGSTPTIEKINEVLEHLEGKINNKQAAQIYNALKYWDRCEHKEDKSKDLFKCADSICNAITGEFINEVK